MTTNPPQWERQPDETKGSYAAFCDYRDMGVGRSLRALHERYTEQSANKSLTEKPPTTNFSTIANWSTKFDWQDRVNAWDVYQQGERDKYYQNARQQLIEDELADYRIQLVKWREAYQITQYAERDSPPQYTNDPKTGERIAVIRVATNSAKMHQLTRWRNDISIQGRRALGLPEKVERSEHTGKDGDALTFKLVYPDADANPTD